MNQTKSSIVKLLDIFRNLLIILLTIYLLQLLWTWSWIVTIIVAIPVYVIVLNIIGFVTLPLYYLSPERKSLEDLNQILTNEDSVSNIAENKSNSIAEILAKIPKAEKAKRMFHINKRKEQIKEFSPKEFSEENLVKAINCINNLTDNNKKYGHSYCKSYRTLEFSKSSIELAFNYLLDSIKFDKNSSIYNNLEFEEELRGLHMGMLLSYIDVEFKEIPTVRYQQILFNSARKIDIGENQIAITKQIDWRNKKQWEYFLTSFGEDSELGRICLEKINICLN